MTKAVRKPGLRRFNKVEKRGLPTLKTGVEKIDAFFSNKGGLVVGSTIFFTGTSGAGKTTFSVLLQQMFKQFVSALYSREMDACDVVEQTERLGIDSDNVLIADKEDCHNISEFLEALNEAKPKVVIIDSLQVLMKEDCEGKNIEKELYALIQMIRDWTSKNDAVSFVIGHVNKDGSFEGPNTIKQMFDAHLHMNFDEKKNERSMSWTKNRKGDVAVKLFYKFTANDMVFFTEEEWEAQGESRSILELMEDVLVKYMKGLNKNHESFADYKEELDTELEVISEMSETDEEITAKVFMLVQRLTLKHGLAA